MPAMAGQPQFPALNLYPLNDSFVPKHIVLAGGARVKIGRQTNAKTVPGEKNGYFDSKVLSRQHAEVWEENGKIYIKDVKSSNGTFINGTRLSAEGVESQPFEMNTDDVVEFGIDIVGEDNQTIIHHKVAAKVQCISTQEDANAAAQQAAYNHQMHQQNMQHVQQSQMHAAGRRPPMQAAGHTALGQIAPVLRPNKTGLSFDHILNRLQSELQRSRETAGELQTLNGTIGDIQEALGGVAPPPLPQYPRVLPPVRQGSDPSSGAAQPVPVTLPEPTAINNLQEQLHQTQSILTTHVEKIQNLGLETIVDEHDGIKREINVLRDMIDQRKREIELMNMSSQMHKQLDEDDDDAKSVSTVVGGARDYEDEEENDEERRRRRDELGRPRTPEPSLGGDGDSDGEGDIGMNGIPSLRRNATIRSSWNGSKRTPSASEVIDQGPPPPPSATKESVDNLTERLDQLTLQFAEALELSRALQTQQVEAQEHIALLQAKIVELETSKEAAVVPPPVEQPPAIPPEPEVSFADQLLELSKTFEGRWEQQQQTWEEERERMKSVRLQFETRFQKVEKDIVDVREVANSAKTLASEASTSAASSEKAVSGLVTAAANAAANGVAHLRKHGDSLEFVAPPSPRSLSSDSGRHRRKRNTSRGRSTSRSPGRAVAEDANGKHHQLANGHIPDSEDGHSSLGYSQSSQDSSAYSKLFLPVASLPDKQQTDSPSVGGNLKSPGDSSNGNVTSGPLITKRKSEIPLPMISAVASVGVVLLGIAAWSSVGHTPLGV